MILGSTWTYQQIWLRFALVNLYFATPSLTTTPDTIYIAQLHPFNQEQSTRALVSAVNYVNGQQVLVPGTVIKLLQVTISADELLEYALKLAKDDVIALIVDSHPDPSHEALSAMLQIPLVTLHESHSYLSRLPSQSQYSISVGPSGSDVTKAMTDVIKSLKRTNILVLYDGRWRSTAMLFTSKLPSNATYSKLALEIDRDSDICGDTKQQLNSLVNAPVEVIALFCDSHLVQRIMDQVHCACSFKVEKPHTWLIADMVPSLSMDVQSSQVVIGFTPRVTVNRLTKYLARSLRCNLTAIYNSSLFAFDAVLAIAHALHDVIEQGRWKPLNQSNSLTTSVNGPTVFDYMRKLKVTGTSGQFSIGANSKRQDLEIDVLNLQYNKFKTVGYWSVRRGLKVSGNIRQNRPTSEIVPLDKLHRKLEVVVVLDSPFVMLNEAGFLEGYSIDLIQEVSQMLGFGYNVYLSPDGLYGGEDGKGGYNGIVGQIVSGVSCIKKADLSTSPLTINSERLQIVEFSKPFMQFTMSLISKKLDNENQYLMAFMRPYSSTVWFLTLGGLLLVTILMYIVNYISPYGYRKSIKSKDQEAFNMLNSLWFCLASMLQQGADSTPRSLSGRVLAGCFWFCILIWISTYTANLAAFFTVRSAGKKVSTLEDVVDGGYHFYIMRDTALHQFFKMSTYHTYRKLWERLNAEKTFVNGTAEGYSVARKKKNSVFMAEKPSTMYAIMREPCDLQAASGLMGASSYGMAMPKHYPYARNMSVAILRLHETGVLDALWRKWWDYRSQCPKDEARSAIGTGKQIDLDSMVGVYVVLACGGLLSIVLVFCEIWWSRHRDNVKGVLKSKFGAFGSNRGIDGEIPPRLPGIEQYGLVSPSPTVNEQLTPHIEKHCRWPAANSNHTHGNNIPVVKVEKASRTTVL